MFPFAFNGTPNWNVFLSQHERLNRIVINLRTFIQQFRFAKSRRYGQAITILYQDAQILANQNAVDKEGVYAHRPRPKRAKSDCPTTGDRGAARTLVRLE